MNLQSPWWLFAGLLAIPTILLYLLKMRRTEKTVSSTLLWQQVLADMRANTPFQKLRRNLLLLLQLLTLAAIVLALTRPTTQGSSAASSRRAIIVDASASMQALDIEGQMSRFEAATELAANMIDNLSDGDMAMLIVAGPAGRGVRTPLTSSRHELHTALSQAIEHGPYDSPATIAEALQLAKSTISAASGGENSAGQIVLISDGAGVALPHDAGISKLLKHIRVGESASNVGFVSLGVETTESARRIVAGVKNFGTEQQNILVNFYHGRSDNWVDSRQVTLDPGQQKTVVLETQLPAGRLWLQMESSDDMLALDNRAYISLPEHRPLNVSLVSRNNPVITRFLAAAQSNGRLKAEVISPEKWTLANEADFIIFDNIVPPDAENCSADTLFINPPVAAGSFVPTGQLVAPRPVNVRTEDAILRFVNTSTLEIAAARAYNHQGRAIELISAGDGPLLAYYGTGSKRRYLLAFHLADSTWATDSGLLILLSNMLDRAAAAHHIGTGQMVLTGSGAEIQPSDTIETIITGPGGERFNLPAGTAIFSPVIKTGFYTARTDDRQQIFAANLLSSAESDINPRNISSANTETGSSTRDQTKSTKRLWHILAAAALVILMAEWWIYHRRIGQ